MVQIPTRARTLSFSVREAGHYSAHGRTRPLDPLARGEEPDAKRARQSYAPIPIRVARSSVPLAPQSVNVTVTAVPFPTNDDPAATEDAEQDNAWGTSSLPSPLSMPAVSSSSPRQKRLIARATSAPTPPPVSARPAPPPPPPAPTTTWTRRPSPLAPYWKPTTQCAPNRTRRGRTPPEPLARRALRTFFSRTPHGAAVVKLGARRAIAQAECVAAVERVRAGNSEIVNARRNAVANVDVVLAPPVVMVSPPSPTATTSVSLPLASSISDDEWVPLSVQPMEVEPDERDIVEMETENEWCRV